MVKIVAPIPNLKFTRADYDRLPEDLRVELIDGELVKMASPDLHHQRLARRIVVELLRVMDEDCVFFAPVDFAIDAGSVFVPDVVVLAEPPPRGAKDVSDAQLVFEVLSPSTAARDRLRKTREYLRAGAREVWLVDPRAQRVEVHAKDGCRTFSGEDEAESRAVPGFRLVPRVLFRE